MYTSTDFEFGSSQVPKPAGPQYERKVQGLPGVAIKYGTGSAADIAEETKLARHVVFIGTI